MSRSRAPAPSNSPSCCNSPSQHGPRHSHPFSSVCSTPWRRCRLHKEYGAGCRVQCLGRV
jgi:hypothetical protein